MCVNFLSLFWSCCFSGSDRPNRFVSDNYFLISSAESVKVPLPSGFTTSKCCPAFLCSRVSPLQYTGIKPLSKASFTFCYSGNRFHRDIVFFQNVRSENLMHQLIQACLQKFLRCKHRFHTRSYPAQNADFIFLENIFCHH